MHTSAKSLCMGKYIKDIQITLEELTLISTLPTFVKLCAEESERDI